MLKMYTPIRRRRMTHSSGVLRASVWNIPAVMRFAMAEAVASCCSCSDII
jgi:alkylhydroperoxidase family enzyme